MKKKTFKKIDWDEDEPIYNCKNNYATNKENIYFRNYVTQSIKQKIRLKKRKKKK